MASCPGRLATGTIFAQIVTSQQATGPEQKTITKPNRNYIRVSRYPLWSFQTYGGKCVDDRRARMKDQLLLLPVSIGFIRRRLQKISPDNPARYTKTQKELEWQRSPAFCHKHTAFRLAQKLCCGSQQFIRNMLALLGPIPPSVMHHGSFLGTVIAVAKFLERRPKRNKAITAHVHFPARMVSTGDKTTHLSRSFLTKCWCQATDGWSLHHSQWLLKYPSAGTWRSTSTLLFLAMSNQIKCQTSELRVQSGLTSQDLQNNLDPDLVQAAAVSHDEICSTS